MISHGMTLDEPSQTESDNEELLSKDTIQYHQATDLYYSKPLDTVTQPLEKDYKVNHSTTTPRLTSSTTFDPSEWDLDRTLLWLQENELEGFRKLFIDNEIYGEKLGSLNYKYLRSLGILSYKDRSRIVKACKKWFPQTDSLTIKTDVRSPPDTFFVSTSIRSPNQSNKNRNSITELVSPTSVLFDTLSLVPESDCFQDSLTVEPIDPLPLEYLDLEEFQDDETFSNPLEVTVDLPLEIELDETFSNPLDLISTPYLIPDETFSNPLDINSTPYLLPEELFSNPLELEFTPNLVEGEAFEAFSDPLEIEPPEIHFEQLTEPISRYHSAATLETSTENRDIYNNINPPRSAPIFSDTQLELRQETDQRLNFPPYSQPMPVSNSHPPTSLESHGEFNQPPKYDFYQTSATLPLITPRKESMINLGKTWSGATSGLSSTQIDSLLSSQRRSSLFYGADPKLHYDNDGFRFHPPPSPPTFSPPSSYSRPPLGYDQPTHKKTLSSSKPKHGKNDGRFLGSLLPDFLNPFSKHNRKLSCPDDLKFDKNKVIRVSLEDGSTYSVNIGGCSSVEGVLSTIFSTLLLETYDCQYQLEEYLFDGSTQIVSPRHLLTLCRRTDNKGCIRFKLSKLKHSVTNVRESINPSHFNDPTTSPPCHNIDETNDVKMDSPDPVLPSWAQLWGERPSTDIISSNLDEFFPNHDLDQPIINEVKYPNFESDPELGRKKSIRMIVEEANSRRQSCSLLSRRSTKLWGSRITQLKDETHIRKESSPPMNQSELSPTSPTTDHGEDFDEFPRELLKIHEQSPCQIQWVKGKVIGKGSFGRVHHALNAVSGEMIAVKIIDLPSLKKKSSQPLNRKRGDIIRELYREIELLKDLDHDNIVQYLGFEANPKSIHIFLEYVSGGSIASVLSKSGPFDELYATNLLRQTLRGLSYLHGCNILHRDIKAANILINNEGVCKISDFGISKKNDYTRAYRFNSRMSFKGSVFWMAPEVVIDQGYSAKVDIWSLGCLLIEMVTGQRPWKELNELAAVYRLGKSTQESAPPTPSGISSEAVSFLGQCFIIEPEQRPTAEELLDHPLCTRGFKPPNSDNSVSPRTAFSPPALDSESSIILETEPSVDPPSLPVENSELDSFQTCDSPVNLVE